MNTSELNTLDVKPCKLMTKFKIAVIMTCHNRKQKTLSCLSALFENSLPEGVTLSVYLVDDGSTDGTSEAVCQTYPDIHILQGNGSLFWTGGMSKAFAEAIEKKYNYYLWLNDDTILYSRALCTLIETFHRLADKGEQNVIVVGATQDAGDHCITYGGLIRYSYFRPLNFSLLEVTGSIQPCHTMNGNCVLIPHKVVELVGNLDPTFEHYLADYDYGLRAAKKGCNLWVAPHYIGTCSNDGLESRKENQASLSFNHLKLLKQSQPKGIPVGDTFIYSLEEWKTFSQRYAGPLWPVYWLLPYRRIIWPLIQKLLGFR